MEFQLLYKTIFTVVSIWYRRYRYMQIMYKHSNDFSVDTISPMHAQMTVSVSASCLVDWTHVSCIRECSWHCSSWHLRFPHAKPTVCFKTSTTNARNNEVRWSTQLNSWPGCQLQSGDSASATVLVAGLHAWLTRCVDRRARRQLPCDYSSASTTVNMASTTRPSPSRTTYHRVNTLHLTK